MAGCRISLFLAILIFIISSFNLSAAPPSVTSIFPAGVRKGTSNLVQIQGQLGTHASIFVSNPGIEVSITDKPGQIKVAVGGSVEPGVHWVRFFNDDGASPVRPLLVSNQEEVLEVEPNDDLSKAQQLPTGCLILNGQHSKAGDSDSFGLTLAKGQMLIASLMANRMIGSPQDAVLQIVDDKGFVVAQNEDDFGCDPLVSYIAEKSGVYFLRTWAFPKTPDSSIRLFGSADSVYRLTITVGPFCNRLVPLAVKADAITKVEQLGWNLSASFLEASPPASATDEFFRLPVAPGFPSLVHQVFVVPHNSLVEVEPNDASQPLPVEVPFSLTGCIETPRDVDVVRFVGKKGQALRFEVIAREVGSLLDPVLRVLDGAGNVVKEVDDVGSESFDPEFELSLPSDGMFSVHVSDRFQKSGQRFNYLLTVCNQIPDFAASLNSDSFSIKKDEEISIPINIKRSGGFAGDIEFVVLGLPGGIAIESAKSESKGASAKSVTLKMKSSANEKFSGPFQIEGRAMINDRTVVRRCEIPLKQFGLNSPGAWLTVLASEESKK